MKAKNLRIRCWLGGLLLLMLMTPIYVSKRLCQYALISDSAQADRFFANEAFRARFEGLLALISALSFVLMVSTLVYRALRRRRPQ